MLTDSIKNEIISGLVSILSDKIEMIILYGSTARGTAGSDSDVDLAIVISDQLKDEEKERFLCWNAELDLRYDRVFSIVDIEKELLDKWGNIVPFYVNLKKEGVVLWKAA